MKTLPDRIYEFLKKRSLLIILLFLQITSLATTIEGGKVLLSSLKPIEFLGIQIEAYVILGCGVQFFLLWLFTFGKDAIKSSLRKLILILVYTLASIYTSFFAIYQGLTDIDLTQQNKNIAINTHNKLKQFIYTPQSVEWKEFDRRIEDAEKERQRAFDEGDSQRYAGRGRLIGELERQRTTLLKKYGYIEKIQPNFEKPREDLEKQKAREIYRDDQNAISDVPPDIIAELEKNKGFNRQDFTEDKYRSEESYFLVPWNKVTKGDSQAILALVLASIIDVTSLVLGTIVNKENKNKELWKDFWETRRLEFNQLSKLLKEILPILIEEIGYILFTILRALGSIVNGLLLGLISAKNRGIQVFFDTSNHIKIEGNRKDFLSGLWHSLEHWNHQSEIRISYKKLMTFTRNNESFKRGYKRLITDMCNLKWLEIEKQDDYEVFFKIKKYDEFIDWYQNEESKQLDNEKIQCHCLVYIILLLADLQKEILDREYQEKLFSGSNEFFKLYELD
ncbi:MAG: hypothetical protein HC836_48365 [Richelia sp. RM2_1_2]|nr:hypothetical protein [Richelia sp. RM2_1_2]